MQQNSGGGGSSRRGDTRGKGGMAGAVSVREDVGTVSKGQRSHHTNHTQRQAAQNMDQSSQQHEGRVVEDDYEYWVSSRKRLERPKDQSSQNNEVYYDGYRLRLSEPENGESESDSYRAAAAATVSAAASVAEAKANMESMPEGPEKEAAKALVAEEEAKAAALEVKASAAKDTVVVRDLDLETDSSLGEEKKRKKASLNNLYGQLVYRVEGLFRTRSALRISTGYHSWHRNYQVPVVPDPNLMLNIFHILTSTPRRSPLFCLILTARMSCEKENLRLRRL